MKKGPILLIDDDVDDREIFANVLSDLNVTNKLVCFSRTAAAYSYLLNTHEQPFIIFCDINIPEESGLDFKKRLDQNPALRQKSIPFAFFTTSGRKEEIVLAFSQLSIQGYFRKPSSYQELKSLIEVALEYWSLCMHPNVGER